MGGAGGPSAVARDAAWERRHISASTMGGVPGAGRPVVQRYRIRGGLTATEARQPSVLAMQTIPATRHDARRCLPHGLTGLHLPRPAHNSAIGGFT